MIIFLLAFLFISSVSCDIGKFVVISDFHYDPVLGGNPGSPADIQFGSDSPFWLMNSTVYALADVVRNGQYNTDFILISGDIVSHELATIPDQGNATSFFLQVLTALTNTFSDAFAGSNKFMTSPVITIGNNDLYPKYAAPYTTPDWLQNFADNWPSINYDAASRKSFLSDGSYTIDITSTNTVLRIIAIHTNYWSIKNKNTTNDADPGGVFQFLGTALADAKTAGVQVYILGHIPPGVDQFDQTPMWQSRFVKTYSDLVTPYLGSTIMAQLFGHEHVSLIHMLSGDNKGVANKAGPIQYHSSISPSYGNYPSFRLYKYERSTFEILDYEDWYMNFLTAEPSYQLLFSSALQEYNTSSLTNNGYCQLIKNMYANPNQFNTYLDNSLLNPNTTSCNITCRTNKLCEMQFVVQDDFQQCVSSGHKLSCVQDDSSSSSVGIKVHTGYSMCVIFILLLLSLF